MKKNYHTAMFLFPIALLLLYISFGLYAVVHQKIGQEFYYDLSVYYTGGIAVLSGNNVYAHPFLTFTYTPFAALLFSSLALLSFETAKVVMTSLSIGAFVLSIYVVLGLLGYKDIKHRLTATLLGTAFLLWTEPIQQTLNLGQINLLLMGAILAGFYKKDAAILKGIGIGLATGIKLTPFIFVVYLFLTRRFMAGFIAVATCLLTIGLGFLFLPIESKQYWGGLFLDTNRIGDILLPAHQSLNGMISRFFGDAITARPYWLSAAIAVGILGLSFSVFAYRKGNELLGILLCAITGLLISPFSWLHHWIWLALMILYVVHLTLNKKSHLGWVFCLFLFILFGWFTPLVPTTPSPPHLVPHDPPTIQSISWLHQSVYVIAGLVFLSSSAFSMLLRNKHTFPKRSL